MTIGETRRLIVSDVPLAVDRAQFAKVCESLNAQKSLFFPGTDAGWGIAQFETKEDAQAAKTSLESFRAPGKDTPVVVKAALKALSKAAKSAHGVR